MLQNGIIHRCQRTINSSNKKKIKINEAHQLLDPGNPTNTKQDSKKCNKPTELYIS